MAPTHAPAPLQRGEHDPGRPPVHHWADPNSAFGCQRSPGPAHDRPPGPPPRITSPGTAPTDPRRTPCPYSPVAPVTRYASPDLIADIVYQGRDPGADPTWAESGAASPKEYARWCGHACGTACLRRVLGHRDGLLHLRNPSGHTPAAVAATLSAEAFTAFSAGRGIVVAPARGR
ncbi:hypothetical protein ACFVWN_07615 [Nocardiopsis flavescens]|uniref:hypothetical protein n=1 Tax=Nocardiopsis flavescens TaxID=758803 RepID=UPI0036690AA7